MHPGALAVRTNTLPTDAASSIEFLAGAADADASHANGAHAITCKRGASDVGDRAAKFRHVAKSI